jgi:hypothetical protein
MILLSVEGRNVMGLPYIERRTILDARRPILHRNRAAKSAPLAAALI